MPAQWATPVKDWSDNALVTAADLDTEIRDRMEFLKAPPTDYVRVDEGADYTTTSTTFVDVDSLGDPDLSLTIVTAGGDVLVGFSGAFQHSSVAVRIALDVAVDGVRLGGDDGLISGACAGSQNGYLPMAFVAMVRGLSAGSHTFKLQWKTASATATLHAGAGTGTFGDTHPQFWVREVS